MRPFAPVRPLARRTADGVVLTWIRRTRQDGDGWDAVDVPLGEESERYEVDIRSGGTVLRTLGTTAPSALYPAAAEIADLGAPAASLSVRICQVSGTVGRGLPLDATLPVL